MCGKHKQERREQMVAPRTGYEGKTIRLGEARANQAAPAHATPFNWGHFPWWTLWLIWPLIGLMKGVVAAGASLLWATAEIVGMIGIQALNFWPLLLIALGLWLWSRR